MSVIVETRARHLPVMASRCFDLLAPALEGKPEAVLVDATLGLGGHAEFFLQRFENLHVIGIDRDLAARNLARERLAPYGDRLEIVDATYSQLGELLARRGLTSVDAILADLGVSSLQLDEESRGFSYSKPTAPLDMRMNQSEGFTAAQFLAAAPAEEIAAVLRLYGEEKYAWPIAKRIVKQRTASLLTTAGQLVEIIRDAIPAPARRHGGNPAKRSFQALRVAVNDELGDLEAFLPQALSALRVGGRMVVESYQSLEDRLVKAFFTAGIHPAIPKGLPIIPPEMEPSLRDLTQGAEKADEPEQSANPRSTSVRLRGVEKIGEYSLKTTRTRANRHGETPDFPTLLRLRRETFVNCSSTTNTDSRRNK